MVIQKATVYRSVMENIEVTVTKEDVKRGTVRIECPSCEGSGKIDWHPDKQLHDCIECSTKGYREVSI